MDNYLIIKVEKEEKCLDYQYIMEQFSITPIIWKEGDAISNVITELYKRVHPYRNWNLFVVEFTTLFNDDDPNDDPNPMDNSENNPDDNRKGNPFENSKMKDIKELTQDEKLKTGYEQCKPPEKIYIIARKEERSTAGKGKERFYGFYGTSICRFIIMTCSKKKYLEKIDELKIISAICLLASNNMPPEIMEAYSVYRIRLDINESMLYEYLKEQKKFWQKEEWDIAKKKWQIENENKRGKNSYEEYIPEFAVDTYESLEIQKIFCGIKTSQADRIWLQEKVQRDVKIDSLQKEQILKQKEINRMMKKRMSLVSSDNLFLEDEEVKKIQKEIEEKQKGLNDSYIEVWKMDDDLEREKEEREGELEAVLKSRYSWGEIINVAIISLFLMAAIFGIFLNVEKELWKEGEIMGEKIPYEWVWDNIKYCGTWIGPLIVIFVGFLILSYAYEANILRQKFNAVMKKITEQLNNNISRYKLFFSQVYRLRLHQDYITRNQNYKLEQKRQMKSLEQRTKELHHAKKNLDLLYNNFKYLENLENYVENVEEVILSRKKIYINNEDAVVDNLLYYVENFFIVKEVSDECGHKL